MREGGNITASTEGGSKKGGRSTFLSFEDQFPWDPPRGGQGGWHGYIFGYPPSRGPLAAMDVHRPKRS
jgi:hypothetical protein